MGAYSGDARHASSCVLGSRHVSTRVRVHEKGWIRLLRTRTPCKRLDQASCVVVALGDSGRYSTRWSVVRGVW